MLGITRRVLTARSCGYLSFNRSIGSPSNSIQLLHFKKAPPSRSWAGQRRGFFSKYLQEREIQSLERQAARSPEDVSIQLRLLQELNKVAPEAAITRYKTAGLGRFGPAVFREYLSALRGAGRLAGPEDARRAARAYRGPGGQEAALTLAQEAAAGGGGPLGLGGLGASPGAPAPVAVQVAEATWSSQAWRSLRVLGVGFIVFSAVGAALDQARGAAGGGPGGEGGAAGRAGGRNSAPMPIHSDRTFKDVVGVDEAKDELKELVQYLRDPKQFTRLGGKLPKGMLLTGPPGTGKTLLARAVAGEAGVPFFYASGSEFEEMYVGVGARRVRDLFAAAQRAAPCIVFVDEIDAIGGSRQQRDHQSMKMTLNQLLVEMDGFKQNSGVVVVAATNYPDVLDAALTRPGRFDRHVAVPLPDLRGRRDVLGLYARKVTLAEGTDLEVLAGAPPGWSGADLQNLMNQAALKASVEGKAAVEGEDLDYARDKILMGAERRTAVISPETARCTAYHEGGHALVALRTRGADPIHKATILPRGPSLGHVAFLPAGDQTSVSRQQMLAKLDVGMGGRAAEELVFGRDRVTSGAASDLQNATRVARAMVTQYGMSPAVGYTALDLDRASPEALATVDREVQRLLREAYGRAKALLASDRRGLERLAGALIQYETLNREEIEEVVRTGKVRGRKKKEQRRDDGERKKEQPAAAQVTKTASTEEKGAEVTGDKKPQEPATAAAV